MSMIYLVGSTLFKRGLYGLKEGKQDAMMDIGPKQHEQTEKKEGNLTNYNKVNSET